MYQPRLLRPSPHLVPLTLCPPAGGRDLHVTEETKREYVKLYVQLRFMEGIEQQFLSLQKGFTEIIPQALLKVGRVATGDPVFEPAHSHRGRRPQACRIGCRKRGERGHDPLPYFLAEHILI